jgi:tRNA modification GTPase
MTLASVFDGEGEPLDRGLAVRFEAPRSYTGEEVVEFHLHGNPTILAAVVDRACELGARAAEPGEFTRRAVVHGRVDLMEAEAIDAIIRAESTGAAKLVGRHLNGELQASLKALRDELLVVAAALEASVDFPEEIDVEELRPDLARLGPARDRLASLEASFVAGRRLVEGARVVLAGPVNAGKSTLFNTLLGHDRAIVSEHPGTTRDVVSETVVWDGVAVRLEDTAGVRDAVDPVELVGIERSRSARREADVVIEVCDGRDPGGAIGLAVATRGDLLSAEQTRRLEEGGWLVVSPASVDAVRAAVVAACREGVPPGELILHTARQRDGVRRAGIALDEAVSAGTDEPVLAALAIRDAGRALEELVGRWVDEAVLDRLFERFCIGK